MNQYETVFILTPVLSDVQMKEAVEKFKGILQAEGAEIINEENWGLKKLAYPIQKKSTGFYQLIDFNASDFASIFCIIRLPNKKMSPFLSNINDAQPVLSLCKRFVSFSRRFIFQRS